MSAAAPINLAKRRLLKLEGDIEALRDSFLAAGRALTEIHSAELYKSNGFNSFEAYLTERWDMKRAHAYRLITAVAAYQNCLQLETADPPQNEAQCRELAKLDDPALQLEAWQRAHDTAPDGRVTAKHVASVVKSMLAPTGTTADSYDYMAESGRMIRGVRETFARCPRDKRDVLINELERELYHFRLQWLNETMAAGLRSQKEDDEC